MYYAITKNNKVVRANSKEKLDSICAKRGFTDYEVTTDAPVVKQQEPSLLVIKNKFLKTIDQLLDKTVQERGYDNIAKCVTYEGDIDPIFNAEGTAAKQWRSRIYRKCYSILAEVEAGERGIPTIDELLAELPKLEW